MPAHKISVTFLRDRDHGGKSSQTDDIAQRLVEFVNGAKHSLHIAIYDFRLSPSLAGAVIPALKSAADRGVDVRIAYDHQIKAGSVTAPVEFEVSDPKPRGTHQFLQAQFAGSKVHIKPIESSKLMHDKFVLRDSDTSSATVWTGSANFTDDAWTYQENNIVEIVSKSVALFYEKDFTELWNKGNLVGTGKGDAGSVAVGGVQSDVDFSPGDGTLIGKHLAAYIGAAQSRLLIASMVLTSGAVLGALVDSLRYHPNMLRGVYDATQMEMNAVHNKEHPMNPQKVALFEQVKPHLHGKKSLPFTPTGKHNFMHNKALVADDVVVTGSFNFSESAMHNAENVAVFHDKGLADQYAGYIEQLIKAYH
jgi:phosphatidylserine/phosphatidylglycerophosphate/cardiolipin synthase-like enzyme